MGGPIWFVGGLDDPWVREIAEALPRTTRRLDCPGDLPECWPSDGPAPASVVIHRPSPNATDAQRIARLKARGDRAPKVILCHGPHARFAELERWTSLVDVAIPEGIARETVARHALGRERSPRRLKGRVAVVSASFEMRVTLAEACRSGGFDPEPVADWPGVAPNLPGVWDVPLLEADWPSVLADRAKVGPVVALLGLADRAVVAEARRHGASACLDLPFDVADLLIALDRLIPDPPHPVPPAPHHQRLNRQDAKVARRAAKG